MNAKRELHGPMRLGLAVAPVIVLAAIGGVLAACQQGPDRASPLIATFTPRVSATTKSGSGWPVPTSPSLPSPSIEVPVP